VAINRLFQESLRLTLTISSLKQTEKIKAVLKGRGFYPNLR